MAKPTSLDMMAEVDLAWSESAYAKDFAYTGVREKGGVWRRWETRAFLRARGRERRERVHHAG